MISIIRQRTIKHYYQIRININNYLNIQSKRSELYFGYGANLSVDRFHKRNMNAAEVGNAVLKDHEIKFTLANEYYQKGYAGVHFKDNAEVWGALYELDYLALRLLDTLEWCGFGAYERKKTEVYLENGEKKDCWCYFVKYPQENLYPSKIYLDKIKKSSINRQFPKSYIDSLNKFKSKEKFSIDHGFSLLFYGKRRLLEKKLRPIYIIHDKFREKICDLI